MEVLAIKSIIHSVIHPEKLFCPLTFGAMTVTAAVITYPLLTAAVAIIDVSAQCCCPALLQGIKGMYHKTIGMASLNKLLSKPIYDLSNFELCTWHYF